LRGGGRIIRPKRRRIYITLHGVVFQETVFSELMTGRNSVLKLRSSWLQWGPTVSSYLFFLHTPPHLRINLQGMFCSQYSIDRPLSTPLLFLLTPLQLTLVPRRTKYNTSFFLFHQTGFCFYCFACVLWMRVCSSIDKLQDSFTLRSTVVNKCTVWLKHPKTEHFYRMVYLCVHKQWFPFTPHTVLTDYCVGKLDTLYRTLYRTLYWTLYWTFEYRFKLTWGPWVWYWYILLTAIGLTPGGSSTVHIYTWTVQNNKKRKECVEKNIHNNKNT